MSRQIPAPTWTIEGSSYDDLLEQQAEGLNISFIEGGNLDISFLDSSAISNTAAIDESYWFFFSMASYFLSWSDDDPNMMDLDAEDFSFLLEQTSFASMFPEHPQFMNPPGGIEIINTNFTGEQPPGDFYLLGIVSSGDGSLLKNLDGNSIEVDTWEPLTDPAILQQLFIDGVEVGYGEESYQDWGTYTQVVGSQLPQQNNVQPERVPEGSMGFGLLAIGIVLFGGICQRKFAKLLA